MRRELAAFLAVAFPLAIACNNPSTSNPPPAASVEPVRVVPPAPPTTPAPMPVAMKTVSWALFKDSEVLTCTDMTGPSQKIDSLKMPEGMTALKQSCDSLGRTALTSCAHATHVIKYYALKYSDKYMASCVNEGGEWTTNKSLEAQQARAEQELTAAKAAAGIP